MGIIIILNPLHNMHYKHFTLRTSQVTEKMHQLVKIIILYGDFTYNTKSMSILFLNISIAVLPFVAK